MTRFAALIALSLLLPGAAFAKSYTLPDDNAIAVITLPDAWSNEETDDGVESTSPDDEVSVAVEVKAAKDVAAAELKLCPVLYNRIALDETISLVDFANVLVERKLLARRNQNTLQQVHACTNIVNAIRG